ncbi:nucleotide-diphospho-sugar transferase [Tanacetum coccineum]
MSRHEAGVKPNHLIEVVRLRLMPMQDVVLDLVVGECHEPNSEGRVPLGSMLKRVLGLSCCSCWITPTIMVYASIPEFVSFATKLKGDTTQKSVNFCTLIAPAGNGTDVAISLESIQAISELSKDGLDAILENGIWFILNNLFIMKKWDPNVNLQKEDVGNVLVWVKFHGVPIHGVMRIYARVMIELRADKELKDTIVVAMPKLAGEGFNLCTIRVEYEWKPPRCLSCKVFRHVLNACPKKIVSNVVMNNPRQATRGVSVGPKVILNQLNKFTDIFLIRMVPSLVVKEARSLVSREKVSNSNPFDALNSVEDDNDLGMNEGNSKSAGKGSSNLAHGSSSNTPIIDKIDKLERQIFDGKLMFVDDDGNPLVPTGNVDSDNEMEVLFDETTNLMASTSFKGGSDKGYGTNSLLKQLRETKRDDDYDPYDDDLYESHDMSDHLQAICDDLDITVRGQKKK